MNANVLVVWTTFPDEPTALSVGRTLVRERLAACAQCDAPIRSIYEWEGELREEEEVRLVLKTRRAAWPQLTLRLAELHPYSVPQIVAVDAEAARGYAEWLRDSTEA